ncbi:hypothetical protein [Leifsonia sp. TF02-11]|nr:hypothetical protein [Leifsonia sp. TF02-11]
MRNLLTKAYLWMDANPAAEAVLWLGLDCVCEVLGLPPLHF